MHCAQLKHYKIMKKKIIGFIGLTFFVGVVAFNVYMTNSSSQANEITLENVEALANVDPGYGMTSYHCDCGIYVMMCVHYGSCCPISQQGVCALDCP